MKKPLPLFDKGTFENLILLNKENNSEDVWLSARWISRQNEFLLESLKGKTPRPHSFQYLLKFINQPLDIVDFGGGSGWLFHSLSLSGIDIKSYVNVESINLHDACTLNHACYFYITPAEVGSHKWRATNSILYFNSVIQYFESDSFMFDIISTINPRTIIIDDLTPSQSSQFFAYQKYYESRIPYRFVDETALIDGMKRQNYDLKKRIPFNRVISPNFSYNFEEVNEDFIIGVTTSLVFERS